MFRVSSVSQLTFSPVVTTVGKKIKSMWDQYLLDQLAYASVLLPPLVVSLTLLAMG
jgi:hypothetical protein